MTGYLGMVLVAIGYWRAKPIWNFLGGLLLIHYTIELKSVPFFFLNLVAIVALAKGLIYEYRTTKMSKMW